MNKPRQQIANAGRILLDLKFQNTHSGNISLRQGQKIYMTRTGSMKGHLKSSDIIDFDMSDSLGDIPGLSSEAGSHRGILEYSNAVVHSHSIAATLMSFLESRIVPRDWLGRIYLEMIPVQAFENPAGSADMEKMIPRILKRHPAMVVKTHGPFVKGESLDEALFHMSVLDYSATILLHLKSMGVDPNTLNVPDYPCIRKDNFPDSWKIRPDIQMARTIGDLSSDMFELQLSPLSTGSISIRHDSDMLLTLPCSTPRYINPVLYRIPIEEDTGNFFVRLHQSVYIHSDVRSAIFSHSPFGMIQSFYALSRGQDAIFPDDAEGRLLYPSIPLKDPAESFSEIVDTASKYKMVVLTGFGVLSLGDTPEQAIHHCSSLRNIGKMMTWHEILRTGRMTGNK